MNSLILAQLLLVYRRKGIDFSGFKMQQHWCVCVCCMVRVKKIMSKGG